MSKQDLYNNSINAIKDYFGISNDCATYLYHRAFRSRRRDDKHMDWNIQLQNAIIKADKCMGLDWSKVHFGAEEKEFANHGIIVNEMDSTVFKWTSDANQSNTSYNSQDMSEEWTVIKKKKTKNKNILMLIRRPGIFT